MPRNTHKAILVLLLLLACMLMACLRAVEPAKPRDFGITDLFLPLDALPDNWQEVGDIQAMGPDSSLGFGDTDDAFQIYGVRQGRIPVASYYVYKNDSIAEAERWYDRDLSFWFSKSPIFGQLFDENSTPKEVSYRSAYADQFHVACEYRKTPVDSGYTCGVIAQYEEFGVFFDTVVKPDTVSLEGFNTIVCHIDALFVARLALSSQPIDCK
ncbi:MAG: hypothetical protein K1X50_08345 [Candidatus Promineofilum sp.]|nr:hypothetical protein [Promineifilum sp.]MCW5863622.1 hypothetical protein [Anaerolineae bacterium]